MSKIIWTNHAKERNSQRLISEDWITQTLNNPDNVIPEADTKKYKKSFGHQTVTVITKYTNDAEELILSTWINPPTPGSVDFKNQNREREMKKATNFKKFWLTILNQFGL